MAARLQFSRTNCALICWLCCWWRRGEILAGASINCRYQSILVEERRTLCAQTKQILYLLTSQFLAPNNRRPLADCLLAQLITVSLLEWSAACCSKTLSPSADRTANKRMPLISLPFIVDRRRDERLCDSPRSSRNSDCHSTQIVCSDYLNL